MVLVVPKKPLEGVWWKYALGLAAFQQLCWYLLGFKLNSDFSVLLTLQTSYIVYGVFIVGAVLPFVVGRLGFTRFMWASFIGYIVGNGAYFMLALFEPARQLNGLLPFISFAQIATTFVSLGVLIELGHYVYRKVIIE